MKALKALAARKKLPFFAISAVTGQGLAELTQAMADRIMVDPAIKATEPAQKPR